MNFTREPIIETIITPREGYKLTLKCTKGGASEYNVDAIEVVNFGTALFYRSLERPKAFLLPMSDFEVLETKETRVAIKSAAVEKSVKIAGGKAKETSSDEPDKKRRRSRRRRSEDKPVKAEEAKTEGGDKPNEAKPVSLPRPTSLFAPPTTLISDKVKAQRSLEEAASEKTLNVEDFPGDEVQKPDPELFETSTEVDAEVKLPTPDKE
ncbi:MAG: hypothetical protein KDK50_03700 [Chlamydiia bacterium]|nr:hypothetical protein [Chlamydiia bacterium]MCP5492463.1 hypothetical protein [Chlamydiales bacterium]